MCHGAKSFVRSMFVAFGDTQAQLSDHCSRLNSQVPDRSPRYAKKLLVIAPDAADAYLGLGTANYIIGSLPGIKKFFLGFIGIHGDKKVGTQQLKIAADLGRYLRPFAKILLALAALGEKKPDVARVQLAELVAEFPGNPLFASEPAKLNRPHVAAVPPR